MSLDMEEKLRLAAEPTAKMLDCLARGQSPLVRSILAEIARSFTEPGYGVSQIKERLTINDRNLQEVTEAIGIPAGKLVVQSRMETGFRLLRDHSLLTVEVVAYLVGYNSKRPFERQFRLWCGLTPAEMRQSVRRLRSDLRTFPEETFSWFFGVRFERGQVERDELDRVVAHIKRVQGMT